MNGNIGEAKPLDRSERMPREYMYAGSPLKFPGATAGYSESHLTIFCIPAPNTNTMVYSVITFGLRLAKFRMICYKDGQQLRRLETFHYGSRPLAVMHPEPIDHVISQLKELEVCWNDTIRKCKSVLADVVRFLRLVSRLLLPTEKDNTDH